MDIIVIFLGFSAIFYEFLMNSWVFLWIFLGFYAFLSFNELTVIFTDCFRDFQVLFSESISPPVY